MSLIAFRRRFLVLLVPLINFIFLALFIFSPSSLPTLSKDLAFRAYHKLSSPISLTDDGPEFEHIRSNSASLQSSDDILTRSSDPSVNAGHVDTEINAAGLMSGSNSAGSGYRYLLEQRKLVEGIELKPLPDHLITSYRPGYLDLALSSLGKQEQGQPKEKLQAPKDNDIDMDPNTKYLTFLPHSGFHNQRTELENALLLARLLNRTLILPKVYLGPPMPWLTFRQLHARLLYQTKIGLEHCRAIIEGQKEKEHDEAVLNEQKQPQQPQYALEQEEYHPGTKPLFDQYHHHAQQLGYNEVSARIEQVAAIDPSLSPVTSTKDGSLSSSGSEGPVALNDPDNSSEDTPNMKGVVLVNEVKDNVMQDTASQFDTTVMVDSEGANDRDENDKRPSFLDEGQFDQENARLITENEEKDGERKHAINGLQHGQAPGNKQKMSESENAEEDSMEQLKASIDYTFGQSISSHKEDSTSEEKEPNLGWTTTGKEAYRADKMDNDLDDYDDYDSFVGIPVDTSDGLEDDEDPADKVEDELDWRSKYFPSRQQQPHLQRRGRGWDRMLARRTMGGPNAASLSLYAPAIKRSYPNQMKDERSLSYADQGIPQAQVRDPFQDNTSKLDKRQRQLLGQEEQQQQLKSASRPQMQQKSVIIDPIPIQQLPIETAPRSELQRHSVKWEPLPAACLQYESWTMTDWDLFFDLNPLRRYVRILTRDSMAMTYLAARFNLTIPTEEVTNMPKCDGASSTERNACPGSIKVETPGPLDNGQEKESDSSTGGNVSNKDSDSEGDSDSDEATGDTDGDAGEEEEEEEDEKRKVPLLRSIGDILIFDDTSLYDYRFTENPMANESIRTRPKFRQEFTIEWLKGRPERLIHLGSIFGTGRISIDSLESKAWLLMIRDHLILQTDILQTTSQKIVNRITGRLEQNLKKQQQQQRPISSSSHSASFLDSMEVGFVGVHVRMSDGHFSLAARDTIENIRQELMWQMGIEDNDDLDNQDYGNTFLTEDTKVQDRLTIEQCRALALNHHRKLQNQLRQQQQWQQQQPAQPPPYPIHYHEQQQDQRAFTPSEATPSDKNLLSNSPSVRKLRRSNGRFTPIYLATDAHQPRANPIFNRLFRTFDCVFSLDDFSEDLEVLHQFRNPEDGTLMANFLIPMVDAMVVAKSAAFFGTPASTFSNYIQRQLRPAYTGLYD
ncbi:hypothetical protein BX616_007691 [Lobosporangium transversale]|nr:hypothetical protein BX616_007691 [Lobosporangium transversale]